ncbi:hypothetical protein ACFE04_031302 [Oxalis oulophora]
MFVLQGFNNMQISFPPGFRFRPNDNELIVEYLMRKIRDQTLPPNRFPEVDISQYNPEELARLYGSSDNENISECYFFSFHKRKYSKGHRPSRSAGDGFWKLSVNEKHIKDADKVIGVKKSLVFHRGKQPHGVKTNWKLHEYSLVDDLIPEEKRTKDGCDKLNDWFLCRIFNKKDKKTKKKSSEENGINFAESGSLGNRALSNNFGFNPNRNPVSNTVTFNNSYSETNLQRLDNISCNGSLGNKIFSIGSNPNEELNHNIPIPSSMTMSQQNVDNVKSNGSIQNGSIRQNVNVDKRNRSIENGFFSNVGFNSIGERHHFPNNDTSNYFPPEIHQQNVNSSTSFHSLGNEFITRELQDNSFPNDVRNYLSSVETNQQESNNSQKNGIFDPNFGSNNNSFLNDISVEDYLIVHPLAMIPLEADFCSTDELLQAILVKPNQPK